jgi:hypothetical protein
MRHSERVAARRMAHSSPSNVHVEIMRGFDGSVGRWGHEANGGLVKSSYGLNLLGHSEVASAGDS